MPARELRRPTPPEKRRPRWRSIAAGAFIGVLATGLLLARTSGKQAESTPPAPTMTTVAAPRSGSQAIDVEVTRPADAWAAYRRATGSAAAPATGEPKCAQGKPEERSWSRPEAPTEAAGRYVCRIEDGRAAMWWTDGATLAHAVASDDDLAALFRWWRVARA